MHSSPRSAAHFPFDGITPFRLPFLMIRWLPLVLITLAGFWLRTHDLARRPMHADEANQAVKLGELLEAGHYAFDPRDHHGPTLYYAAVPIARLRGERSLAELTETTVRLVPALFGTLTVFLVGVLAAPLGRWASLTAAVLVAVSPPAVYYSRYFIQETLLLAFVLLAILCARKWLQTRLTRWAFALGICAGLAQATKASAPLFLLLALFAGALASRFSRADDRSLPSTAREISRRSWVQDLPFALLGFLLAAAALYSSFGSHLAGLRDALGVYAQALTRFGADAAPTGHEKPWWYYLRLFGWYREGGFVWHQLGLSTLAALGFAVAWMKRGAFPRGVALYTFAVVAVFSVFAYKTPWHAVHFVPGLAALAVVALSSFSRGLAGQLLALGIGAGAIGLSLQQTRQAVFLRPADQRNPYAYVHSSVDVLKFRDLALAAQARQPGRAIRVISEEYWPLPWYFRGLPRVGYYATPPDDCDGALVIASQAMAEAVRARLHGAYRESFVGLRPGVVMVLFTPES